jgi:methylmalonyl-CoA mutase N-terminal domain/subunit
MSSTIQQRKEEWEATTLGKTLKRFPERLSEFKTESAITAERVYTLEDVQVDYAQDLGFPGEYPFTRGVQPTMYRGRFWTMRQYAGFGSASQL